jgi:cobalt-zinc-cadmium efflux system membrane fusion protein
MKTKLFYSILFTFFLFSCGNKEESSQSPDPNQKTNINQFIHLTNEQLKNSGFVLGKADQRNISSVLKVNGKIEVPPQNLISISVPMGGYLKETKLIPGMLVKKGEVIATIEDQQYIQLQQEFLTTKNKLFFLEKEFERQKELNQSKSSSDKIFQEAENNFKEQKIILKSLSEKLRLIGIIPEKLDENNLSRTINLFAPINGFVSLVNVNIGKYVNPSDVLFELINPDDIHLVLTVFEKDIQLIAVGQKLLAFTNNDLTKKYPCEILLISQNLNSDRSMDVHCHFYSFDKLLIPGMYMNAEIEYNTNEALVLPDDAIVNFESKNYVFISKSATDFEMKEVTIGESENGFIQLLNADFIKNKNVVVKNAYNLLMTLKNRAEEE